MENSAAINNQPEELTPIGDEQMDEQVELTIESTEETNEQSEASVKTVRFAPLGGSTSNSTQNTMDMLYDVNLEVTVELGRATIPVRDVLQLGPGSIVELNKLGGEPVDVLVNGRPIARGEVVVVDENFGVRITELVGRG